MTTTPTTAAPTTGTLTTGEMPTEKELKDALDGLYARYAVVLADPEDAQVKAVCATNSLCERDLNETVFAMVSYGHHVSDQTPLKVAAVVMVKDLSTLDETVDPGTQYWTQFNFDWSGYRAGAVIDPNGDVYSEIAVDQTDQKADRTIVRWPEDHELPWRFID